MNVSRRHCERRRCGRSHRHGATHPDRGFSVVEVVVSVVVMAIIAVPLLDTLWGAVRSSSHANESSRTQTVLQDAADRINRAPLSCSYTVYAQAAALALGWESDQVTTTHKRFVPGATPMVAGTWLNGACAGPQPDERTLQMVVVTVTSPRLGVVRTIEVLKSSV
jgi:prepilin-type N-terminal cleavage/methylation domain-containing protein